MKELSVCHVVERVRDTSTPVDLARELSTCSDIEVGLLAWQGVEFTVEDDVRVHDLSQIPFHEKIRSLNDTLGTYDIVHTHHHRSGFYSKITSRVIRNPVVHTEHNNHEGYGIASMVTNTPSNVLADRIVCVSESVRDSFYPWEELLVPEQKISTIYNGADLTRVKAEASQQNNVRDEYSINDDSVLIGNASMQTHQKGQDILIKSLPIINRHTSKDVEVILTGNGPKLDKNKDIAENLGVADQVHFTGYLESRGEVFDIMNEADIFSFPSRWEGHCISTIETMSLGTPCILSDIPSFRNPYTEVAIFHDTDDIKDHAFKALELIDLDKSERASIGQRSADLVHEKYSMESMSRSYRDLYLDVSDRNDVRSATSQ